ncbi:nitrate regulatory gene2 protein-like [Salvia splendens]|uniref:nitrate regulatory gene2 protein-like n=1 Tax=Salvia splendens TaxID=180675 RepID=UPI001C27CB56|nr:nitrate regulatory gene2 protein-like [Salvia splendens]XP_041990425.1 nitrate regulatory gene2 protein-like [Salvia splendens]XP_041990426.1 nitrate regulatory gene2 protein-like [Salvia splendens]
MGASNSRLEEDKSLQLCRARKKFIKQALNGRCSLAAAHTAYIGELKIIGAALRRFVEPDHLQVESLVYPSITATPQLLALTDKSFNRLSSLSPSQSQDVDATENLLPSPSPRVSSQYQAHPMKFTGTVSSKIEEKPPVPVVVSVDSTTPPVTTPRSTEGPESPWDYFGLFHHVDNDYSAEGKRMFDQGSEDSDEIRHLRKEEGIPDLEDVRVSVSSEETHGSEEEFDEPPIASLVRSFKNVNTGAEGVSNGESAISTESETTHHMNGRKADVVNGSSADRHPEAVVLETNSANGRKNNSPGLSLRRNDKETRADVRGALEDKVVPKDLYSSISDIEQLFVKASESGKEVPRMLEANKLHFRPVLTGRERRLAATSLLKSCFSCGKDPSEVQQEPSQNSVKYLTWPRSASFRSLSSRNLVATNSNGDIADPNNTLFDNFCMVSGSHASTLDRLYAWEKKLYDEVKASEALQSSFEQKCKLLRQRESRGENTEKTRAAAKDLHSRITVAIHRINAISQKIEVIRDTELQPQLEELIEELRKMWETMMDCHKLQELIISKSHAPGSTKLKMQSDSQRQIIIQLGYRLSSLSSSFTKWISAQKIYVEAIDKWLFKCVSVPQKKPSKRNRRMRPPSMRHCGPPIYMLCGAWLEMIDTLPSKGVADSIKELAAEVAQFLPRQEKKQAKANRNKAAMDTLRDLDYAVPRLDRVRTSLEGFLVKLNSFAECSLRMFTELQKATQDAKMSYEQFLLQRSQSQVVV